MDQKTDTTTTEKPTTTTTTLPEKTTQVTPVTTPTQTATTEAPATPAAPVINEKEITDKVSRSLLEKIGDALNLNKEEKAKLPTDPEELAKFVREEGRKGAEEVLTEREKENQEAEEAKREELTQGSARFTALWKDQYDQLSQMGKVPKIVKADDPNDPGVAVKKRLLTKLAQILKENQEKGIDYVPTLKEIYYEHPEALTVAGATVPISGGGRFMAQNQSLSYDALHKKSIEDMIAERHNES